MHKGSLKNTRLGEKQSSKRWVDSQMPASILSKTITYTNVREEWLHISTSTILHLQVHRGESFSWVQGENKGRELLGLKI